MSYLETLELYIADADYVHKGDSKAADGYPAPFRIGWLRTLAAEVRESLAAAVRERDEARAECERLGMAYRNASKH